MKRRSFALAILTAAVFSLSAGSTAFAANGSTTYWVDDDGFVGPKGCAGTTAAQTDIQTAAAISDANDTVNVCPGTYVGAVSIFGAQHNGLTLRSVQEHAATIKASDGDNVLVYILNADRVHVLGFRLVQPTVAPCSELGYMIRVQGSRGVEIRDNDLRATGTDTLGDCQYVYGIHITNGSSAVVRDNVIKDFWLIGIFVTDDSRADIFDNSIRYYHVHEPANAVFAGIGVRIIESSGRIQGNTIVGLASGGSSTVPMSTGMSIESTVPGDMVIRNNVIRRTHFGLQLSTSGALLRDNVSLENFGSDCSDGSTGSGTAGTANTWTGNLGDPAKSNPAGICALP